MADDPELPGDAYSQSGMTNLSNAARAIWAKSETRTRQWLQLPQHMIDSGAMAERLFDHWLAPGLRQRWGQAFPGGEEQARTAFVFLAAAHDVGKASPVFVAQVETLAERSRHAGLTCQTMDRLKDDRRYLPHATVSHHALTRWLTQHGASPTLSAQLASVVGAHHGRPVNRTATHEPRRRAKALGFQPWQDVRTELLDWLDDQIHLTAHLPDWGDLTIPLPVLVGMSGLVIMADWLASNQHYLPLRPLDDDLSPALAADLDGRWSEGWAEVAMPPAWAPPMPGLSAADLYRTRFGWGPERTPRPLQREALDLVRREDVGMLIVEAEMGSGKTEIAFAAAEILAARWGAQGLFVALPTQATTDAMFDRMLPWLQGLPERPADVPAWAMTLAHGKAALNPKYAEYVEQIAQFDQAYADIDHVYDDDCHEINAVVHQWFNSRKRRLLANFGIGTIDQLLMAGLNQRHLMLRHLALAGKVVVVDEVHASDAFMNVYLDTVLNWLGHYGVPVILLSATLTNERKQAMLQAYAPHAGEVPGDAGYPLLTWVSADRTRVSSVEVPDPSPGRTVRWQWHQDSDENLATLLREQLCDGGCALIVRNTVADAQRCADYLESLDIAPVILAHARFIAVDRVAIDTELRECFGPDASHPGVRPERAIVVATQVVEQSLDVDFDLLVTDLAPMDLLFQRIGRLHRHAWRTRPAPLTQARVHVLTSTPDEALPKGSSGSHAVYGDHLLLRTAWVLQQHGPTLRVPHDIAPLTQRAIGHDPLPAPPELAEALTTAEADFAAKVAKQQDVADGFSINPWHPEGAATQHLGEWLKLPNDPSEALIAGMVRDTTPTLEVVLVPLTPDGLTAIVPPWLSDPAVIDTSSVPDDDTARQIATWSVRLPARLTRWPGQLEALIAAIAAGPARAWRWGQHRLLKGELFLPMRQAEEGSWTLHTTIELKESAIHLRYTPNRGLEEVAPDVQSDR